MCYVSFVYNKLLISTNTISNLIGLDIKEKTDPAVDTWE